MHYVIFRDPNLVPDLWQASRDIGVPGTTNLKKLASLAEKRARPINFMQFFCLEVIATEMSLALARRKVWVCYLISWQSLLLAVIERNMSKIFPLSNSIAKGEGWRDPN